MNVVKMHNVTIDERLRRERLIELRDSFLAFKDSNSTNKAMNVIKNCLSLVNDVIDYSQPIRLETYYYKYAKSFIEDSLDYSGRFNFFRDFDRDYEHYLKWELSNDLAPRFYCKQWFSTVVAVLESNGMTLDEIENKYYDYLENPQLEQTTIFEFV